MKKLILTTSTGSQSTFLFDPGPSCDAGIDAVISAINNDSKGFKLECFSTRLVVPMDIVLKNETLRTLDPCDAAIINSVDESIDSYDSGLISIMISECCINPNYEEFLSNMLANLPMEDSDDCDYRKLVSRKVITLVFNKVKDLQSISFNP